jgi:hypothetical protein
VVAQDNHAEMQMVLFVRSPRKTCLCGISAFCALSVVVMRADSIGTNEMSVMFPAPKLTLGDNSAENEWESHFDDQLLKNQNVLFDHLGPRANFDVMFDERYEQYGIHEAVASRAESTFQRVFQDSARETALAILPVDEWLAVIPESGFRTFVERLFEGSLGDTTERELRGLPATYSATESWWRTAGRDQTFRYGIRPEAHPYFYMASRLGHWDNRPLLTLESRARYLPLNRFETSIAATVPLPFACELSLSALCQPARFSQTTDEALRLQRVIGTGASACAVFLGVSRSSVRTDVLFGITRPW